MERPVHIVYYVYINPNKQWRDIIHFQLTEMYNSGILEKSVLSIEICCERTDLVETTKSIINDFFNDKPDCKFYTTFSDVNRFEYHGIKKIYDSASEKPDKVHIYIHSKGMFFGPCQGVSPENSILTTKTLEKWRETLKLFNNDDEILKAALIPSNDGFSWFNFFWASSKYLKTCEEPQLTDNRWYYEGWLGTGDNSLGCTYNLLEENCNTYTHEEALDKMHRLKYNIPC
jgi:hypothetical protein